MDNMTGESALQQKVIAYRRALHRVPELDFELPRTRSFLLSVLEPLGFKIRDYGKAGFSAYYDCGKVETIAFRSDMDAVPIQEPVGCSFASVHDGAMHACGHDGHMSMLLGLASQVAAHPEAATANSLLIFQAAEETIGGAKGLCNAGVLRDRNVSRIYALHLWPDVPENTILCRPNEFMAGTFVIDVAVAGRSAHIAEWQIGADALEAGCSFVLRAYELDRELPKAVCRLIRFGEFFSGTASNIISDRTRIMGTVRAFDNDTFAYFKTGLEKIMRDLERTMGVKFTYHKSEGYPPLINPPELYSRTQATLTKAGFTWEESGAPNMQAEDFSYYQHEIPGLYMHLGMGGGARLHNPDFTLNESVLMTGVQIMWTLLKDGPPV